MNQTPRERKAAEKLLDAAEEVARQLGPDIGFVVDHDLVRALEALQRAHAELQAARFEGSDQRTRKWAKGLKRRPKLTPRRKAKREEMKDLRALALERAKFLCEHCGRQATSGPELEMDHFFGRRGLQSASTVWMLCRPCHRDKTRNEPATRYWLERFVAHCERHRYSSEMLRAEARLNGMVAVREGEKKRRGVTP